MPADPLIFIIDDDDAVRDSLALLVDSEGLRSATYASANGFLDAVEPAASGCIIADVRMPGLTGLQLIGALRDRGIAIPVILITGHGDVPMAVAALKAGAADFFEKPFDEALLMASVRAALDRDASRRQTETVAGELRRRQASLTPREREVMDLVAEGHPNKVVADRLAISPRTVEIYRAKVMEKMQARNLSDLVRMAIQLATAGPT